MESKALVKKQRARGAGRPLTLEHQIEEARALAKQLQAATSLGLKRLAQEYPELMDLAIKLAKGGHEVTRYDKDFTPYTVTAEPNVAVLKTLLELLPKAMGEQVGEDLSPIAGILRNLRAEVANIQINVGKSVDEDSQGRTVETWGVTVEGVDGAIPSQS